MGEPGNMDHKKLFINMRNIVNRPGLGPFSLYFYVKINTISFRYNSNDLLIFGSV